MRRKRRLPIVSTYNEGVEEDLRVLGAARRYQQWLWEEVAPFVGGRVFEIGSGIGTYSAFLSDREHAILSDYDPRYVEILRGRFADRLNVEVIQADAADLSEGVVERVARQRIDTVLCLNVLEHIRDDEACVRALGATLTPGGRVVLILPAHPALFSTLDREYGHFRRYVRGDAARLAAASNLRVLRSACFNLAGLFGWLVNHRILGRTRLPKAQTSAFDRLVPLFRAVDGLGSGRVGLSLTVVLEKP